MRVDRYQIDIVPVKGTDEDIIKLHVHGQSTSFEATGLRAATQYQHRVAAHNRLGGSPWSEPVLATTLPASQKPTAPRTAPKVMPVVACDTVAIKLDALRAGCNADASLVVERAPAGARVTQWTSAVPASPLREVNAMHLDVKQAYIFRTRARNAIGLSDPGPSSEPVILGDPDHILSKPPDVEALSSSRYRVSWEQAASLPCHPHQLWRLEYRRASEGQHAWQTLLDRTQLTHHEPQLRCPLKCSFRFRPLSIAGWSGSSEPSEPLATRQLRPISRGAVRLEAIITNTTEVLPSQMIEQSELELAAALRLPRQRIKCAEVREEPNGAWGIVFDVLSTSQPHGLGSPSGALRGDAIEADEEVLLLAQQLAQQLLNPVSSIRTGSLFAHVDVVIGLLQLTDTGNAVHVTILDHRSASSGWGLNAFKLFSLASVITACVYRLHAARRTYRYTSVKAPPADDFDVLDEDPYAPYIYDDRGASVVHEVHASLEKPLPAINRASSDEEAARDEATPTIPIVAAVVPQLPPPPQPPAMAVAPFDLQPSSPLSSSAANSIPFKLKLLKEQAEATRVAPSCGSAGDGFEAAEANVASIVATSGNATPEGLTATRVLQTTIGDGFEDVEARVQPRPPLPARPILRAEDVQKVLDQRVPRFAQHTCDVPRVQLPAPSPTIDRNGSSTSSRAVIHDDDGFEALEAKVFAAGEIKDALRTARLAVASDVDLRSREPPAGDTKDDMAIKSFMQMSAPSLPAI